MEIHRLKTLPTFFEQTRIGKKTFELRKNDRNFQVGDWLKLEEHTGGAYTNRCVVAEVVYILSGVPEFGLAQDCCIMAIKVLFILP